jgi:SulP family sulfate permease
VLVDLTVAIEAGIVLGAVIFMHRMAEATAMEKGVSLAEGDVDDFSRPRTGDDVRAQLPHGTELFTLRGPLFFGAASRLSDAFEAAFPPPRAFILRLKDVPMADSSGVGALERFLKRCAGHGTKVIIAEMHPRVRAVLSQLGALAHDHVLEATTFEDAIAMARRAIEAKAR